MVDVSLIRDATILADITHAELQELAEIAHRESIGQGNRLFVRGEPAEALYVVTAGRFALTIQLRALDESLEIPVEEKVAGDALGWSALVEPYLSVYSAYCTQHGSVVAFPREDLKRVIAADVDLGYRLLRNLSQLIGSRIPALQDLWTQEVEQSMERVQHWAHTRLYDEWATAVAPPRHRRHWWRHPSH
jgi:CRP-like cAMP-binding protein